MSGLTSIINSLLRIMPVDAAASAYKAVFKLHPKAENLSDATLTNQAFSEHSQQWLTRHAYEACRGWHWPFWMNAQTNPGSKAYNNPNLSPALSNQRSRDAVIVPGLSRVFTGTFDRRGMVTPGAARFSIETWFRFGENDTFYPANLLQENDVCFGLSGSFAEVRFRHDHHLLTIQASSHEIADFRFIRIRAKCTAETETTPQDISICFSIRPYHLLGVVPLHDLVYNSRGFWMSDSRIIAWLPVRPEASWASDARHDDAAFFFSHPPDRTAVRCAAGMATAISTMHFPAGNDRDSVADIIIPLEPTISRSFPFIELSSFLKGLRILPDKRLSRPGSMDGQDESAARAAAICSAQLSSAVDYSFAGMREEFHGRFRWLPAVTRALLSQSQQGQAAGLLSFAGLSIQKNGYLAASGGRWALQGMYLTALAEYYTQTERPVDNAVVTYVKIRSMARWIIRKRREVAHASDKPKGLLPPGVTANGLGMEYNLADNLWALEGLMAMSTLARLYQEHADADNFRKEAERYAARISAAIHRELEYGLSQMVPARLQRSFDSASASELLDLAFLPEVRRLLKADDWLGRIVSHLYEPIYQQPPDDVSLPLRKIDTTGVYPAKRMMLCLMMKKLNSPTYNDALMELQGLQTPMGIWTECIDPATKMGTGRASMDIEAAALFLLLMGQNGSV